MDFEDLEDAIITALKGGMGYLRTCETYGGQLQQDLDKIVIPTPAVFVSYGGSRISRVDNITFNDAPAMKVLVVDRNPRGNEALRKGTDGCYQMIKDVKSALTNKNLGLALNVNLQPSSVQPIFISQTLAVYGIEFQTNFDETYQ